MNKQNIATAKAAHPLLIANWIRTPEIRKNVIVSRRVVTETVKKYTLEVYIVEVHQGEMALKEYYLGLRISPRCEKAMVHKSILVWTS